MTVEQGHPYTYLGERFLAMESAQRGLVLVRRIAPHVPVIGMERAIYVNVDDLKPAPLRYLGGQLPGGEG